VASITEKTYLTFDDVLLQPGISLESRNSADYSQYRDKLGDISHPIIPANMDTVSGVALCRAQLESGGIAILHRFMSTADRYDVWRQLEENPRLFLSVGINEEEGISALYQNGIRNFCIDIAHAHAKSVAQTIKLIKSLGNSRLDTIVIAGNIATIEAYDFLAKAGADIIKVGIGPGSHCTTRIVTGCGVPQLSAILDIARHRDDLVREGIRYISIIGDGGLKKLRRYCKGLSGWC